MLYWNWWTNLPLPHSHSFDSRWQKQFTTPLLYRSHISLLNHGSSQCPLASCHVQRPRLCIIHCICWFPVGSRGTHGLIAHQEAHEILGQSTGLFVQCKGQGLLQGGLGYSWHVTTYYICLQTGSLITPPFSAFIAKFPNDFAHHHVPRSVLKALTCWEAILQSPLGCCSLLPHTKIWPGYLSWCVDRMRHRCGSGSSMGSLETQARLEGRQVWYWMGRINCSGTGYPMAYTSCPHQSQHHSSWWQHGSDWCFQQRPLT